MHFLKKIGYLFTMLSLFGMTSLTTVMPQSAAVRRAEDEKVEIQDKGDRLTWVDASVQLPYNYASIIGFKVNVTLLTDHTNYVDGYGGVTEDPSSPEYNMKFPCYMLVVSRGSLDNTQLNKDAFGCEETENYEHYLDEDVAAKEIVKLGVGAGYYVAAYLDNGQACKDGKNMVAGDSATLTYQGTEALFDQNDPMMTFYGYTAEFQINSIEWITGTPVISDQEDWSIVEKETIADVETVENSSDQNGSNYVNIIRPKTGDGPFPVVLWIHGGAWSTSSRTDIILNTTMEYFLAKGYAFVSAEYTLTDLNAALTEEEQKNVDACTTQEEKDNLSAAYQIKNASHGKQMIYDLKLAVRFLRANASKYNLDTSFITAMGESAGAHLSLLMATTNDSDEHEGENGQKYGGYANYSSSVQCAVSYSLPSDFTNDSVTFLQDYKEKYPLLDTAEMDQETLSYSNWILAYYVLGYSYIADHLTSDPSTLGTMEATYDEEVIAAEKFMSPYWQVNADSAPMYLIHGEKDGAVSIAQAYAMELMAKQYMEEEDVKTAYYPEAGHVEKKYFDAYAQYVSSYEFVEEKRAAYLKKEAEKQEKEDQTSSSQESSSVISSDTSSNTSSSGNSQEAKGCFGSLVTLSTLVGSFSCLGLALALKHRKDND